MSVFSSVFCIFRLSAISISSHHLFRYFVRFAHLYIFLFVIFKCSCLETTWAKQVEVLVSVRCKSWPPRMPNSKVVFTKSSHGAFARYECNEGYRPSGTHNTVKCLYGEWTSEGEPFSCQPSNLTPFYNLITLNCSIDADHF